MDKDAIYNRLLDMYKEMVDRCSVLEKNGLNFPFLETEAEKIEDLILDIVGIPEDNTKTIGMDKEDSFCRDMFTNCFYDYRDGEITKDDLIDRLIEWNKEYGID